jgi:hypothetical protein
MKEEENTTFWMQLPGATPPLQVGVDEEMRYSLGSDITGPKGNRN